MNDFSHIWDFISDTAGPVDVDAATDHLHQQSSSCSSSSSSHNNYQRQASYIPNPNNTNNSGTGDYSFSFINTNSATNGHTKHSSDLDVLTSADFNSILFSNPTADGAGANKNNSLSFLNFAEDSGQHQKSSGNTNDNIDDFLMDFQQPVDDVQFDSLLNGDNNSSHNTDQKLTKRSSSQSGLTTNSAHSQILTPPGSASSQASQSHEQLICQSQPLTISDQMRLITTATSTEASTAKPSSTSPRKPTPTQRLSPNSKAAKATNKLKQQTPPSDTLAISQTVQSSFLTPSPSSCSSSSPSSTAGAPSCSYTASASSATTQYNLLPNNQPPKGYTLALSQPQQQQQQTNCNLQQQQQDSNNLLLFINSDPQASATHSQLHSASSSDMGKPSFPLISQTLLQVVILTISFQLY